MKHFLKVFVLTTLMLGIIVGVGSFAYMEFFYDDAPISLSDLSDSSDLAEFKEEMKSEAEEGRINILFVGKDGQLTDTIMLGTYDLEENDIDIISIPRDTYYESGYSGATMKKINAVYPMEGIRGTVRAVEDLLGIDGKINYYVELDYEGVKNIVDSVGGVEMDVPMNMRYSDPSARPPLNINIQKGNQVLDGEKSIQFLRYRSGYADGDLGRVSAQQEFIKGFADSAISRRLPNLIRTAVSEVETNIGLTDALRYSGNLISIRGDDIRTHMLPGEATYKTIGGVGLSYFDVDKEKLDQMIGQIFGRENRVEGESTYNRREINRR